MCLLLIRTNPWSFLVSSFFSFAIWRFHDYFNPNIEVQRHHTLHIHLEVRIWYLEQLKKGDFNSAILSRQEPIINQQATDATKLEMERKKLEKHSFVLCLHVKWHLVLDLQNVQLLFLKIVQFTAMMILKQGPPAFEWLILVN